MPGISGPLRRSRSNRMIAGVVGGLADYFGIDPVILRIVFIFSGIGLLAYFIIGLIIPMES